MKKLLLLLFVTLIPFSSFATYLVCDGGFKQFVGEADYEEGPGDDFEVQLLDNNLALLYGLPFCQSPEIYYLTSDTHSHMACNHSANGSIQKGFILISRASGSYSYDFKVNFEGTQIAWFMQEGKCIVGQKNLF